MSACLTALKAHARIVDNRRDNIVYHSFLDHYGVQLDEGNMFERAKDMKGNGYNHTNQDKDIVFVLNPEPCIRAGVDPAMAGGWGCARVSVETGGTIGYVWKCLKAFDVK